MLDLMKLNATKSPWHTHWGAPEVWLCKRNPGSVPSAHTLSHLPLHKPGDERVLCFCVAYSAYTLFHHCPSVWSVYTENDIYPWKTVLLCICHKHNKRRTVLKKKNENCWIFKHSEQTHNCSCGFEDLCCIDLSRCVCQWLTLQNYCLFKLYDS